MNVIKKSSYVAWAAKTGNLRFLEDLDGWYERCRLAEWRNFADVKQTFNDCDHVKGTSGAGTRLVFNIRGNKLRLIAGVIYAKPGAQGTLFIKFVGTHADYDKIDPKTVAM